jgi:pimeloyl-ACP methyl ester carboxylesterase
MISAEGDGTEGLEGFQRRTVELEAGRIHYWEAGSGEPLLFVHGWAVNGTLWREPATALAGSHRCIVPDLPFGSHPEPINPEADLSPPGAARIVSELIAALGLDGVTIVANDSGGAISQILVTERPTGVARLVLTNCDALEQYPPGIFKLLVKALRMPGFMAVLVNSLRFGLIQRSPLAYGALSQTRIDSARLDGWVRPAIEQRGVRRDSRRFGVEMDPRHTLDAAEKLPGLRIPVLLAWGERDRNFKIELAERLAKLIPDSRLVRFRDSSTFVSIDEPERLAAEISAFIADTAAASGAVSAPGAAGP